MSVGYIIYYTRQQSGCGPIVLSHCVAGCKKCGQCNRYAKCEVKCVCKKGFIGDGLNCEGSYMHNWSFFNS